MTKKTINNYTQTIRLHQYIVKNLSSLTTNNYVNREIQNNITKYGVYIDSELMFDRLNKIWGNETIEISHWPTKEKASYEGIRIVWENKYYLVLYKPFGLPVQSGAGHTDNNLVNWLLDNIPSQKELINSKAIGEELEQNNVVTAGLVHRIDKDTQGLILIAKSLEALNHAQNQFRNRTVTKSYLTTLSGLLNKTITIEGFQYREIKNKIKQIFVTPNCYNWTLKHYNLQEKDLRDCKTTITPLITDSVNTFCKVVIHTGRMHQIRLAGQSIGHPVLNDKIYSNIHQRLSELDLAKFEQTEKQPQLMDNQEFTNLLKKVFCEQEYNLLANELIFEDMEGVMVSNKLFDFEQKK